MCGCLGELRRVHPEAVVPAGAFDAPACVVDFPKHHVSGDAAGRAWVICHPVLGPPEKDIPGAFPSGSGQEAPPWRAEGQGNVSFRAGPHQGRGGTGIGEGDDSLQRVEWIAGQFFPVLVGHNVFSVQGEVDVLGGDEKGVQQVLHNGSSMALAKYAETEPWRASRGRQRSFREQLRQALVGRTLGV